MPSRSLRPLLLITLFVLAAAPAALAQESAPCLFDWGSLWVPLLWGALGGLALELTLNAGNFEWPHKRTVEEDSADPLSGVHAVTKFLIDLGVIARLVVGALAAVAVLWLLEPKQGVRLIAVSLIAGFSGPSVFEVLKDRLLAALKEQNVQTQAALATAVQAKLAAYRGASSRAVAALPAGAAAAIPHQVEADAELKAAESLLAVIAASGTQRARS